MWRNLMMFMMIDSLFNNDEKEYKKNKSDDDVESFFVGLLLLVGFSAFVYFILIKVGIPADQLQQGIVILLSPYLWNYYVDYTFFNFSQLLHAVASMFSVLVALLFLIAFIFVQEKAQNLSKSNFSVVNSIGFYVYMTMHLLRLFTVSVILVNLFKVVIHLFISLTFWFFN